MNTTTRTRIARTTACAVAASITAVTTTVVAPPTTASAPTQDRPCFIVQPRWNVAIDGPAPTCPIPPGQQSVGTADVATMADCVDPAHRPVVTTCPYPIRSGDRFATYVARGSQPDEQVGTDR